MSEDLILEHEAETATDDTESVSDDSVRADIEAAMAEVEKTTAKEPEEKTDQTDKASTEVVAKAEPQAAGTEKPAATDSQTVAPPSDWSADKREAWTKLPQDIQKYLVSRQSEVQAFVNQKSQEAARLSRERDAFYQAISPRAEVLQAAGVHPVQYIENLIKAEQMMDANPVDALQRLAAHYKIDLAELAHQATQPVSPDVLALRNELNALRQQQQESQTVQQQRAYEQYRGSVASVVEDFKGATDDSGQPLFPHARDPQFEAAMGIEAKLLRSQNPQMPIEDVLVKAYDATVWKLPNTRQAEIEKQTRIAQARATSAAKTRSEQARAREASIVGAPGASAVKVVSNGSVRDDIRAAMESLGL